MNIAVIGLGSNIDPKKNITWAKELLAKRYHMLKESQFCQTKPVGFLDQADFINGAVLLETDVDMDALRRDLKQIETDMGRTASAQRHGPRTIDLDIIVWNEKVIDQDFYERDFIKKSVLELIPDLKH